MEELLKKPPGVIRYSVSFTKDIPELLDRARTLGLEGLIGKRAGSRYEAGKRSGAWIKVKLHQEQEFVIGGYTEPEGSRKYFGALLVGFYEGKKLKFAGRVGTGFTGWKSSFCNSQQLLILRRESDLSCSHLINTRFIWVVNFCQRILATFPWNR